MIRTRIGDESRKYLLIIIITVIYRVGCSQDEFEYFFKTFQVPLISRINYNDMNVSTEVRLFFLHGSLDNVEVKKMALRY